MQTTVAEARPPGDVALFHFVATQLPPFGAGLFIAACLGAIMSTYDAGLHSLATVYVKDVHLVHLAPGLSEEQQVRLSRLAIAAIAFATMAGAFAIGYTAPAISSSFIEAHVFWVAFQGILAMWFLIGILSTRVNGRDVLRAFGISILVTVVAVVWYVRSRGTDSPVSFLFVSVPGEICMLVFGLLPSLWRQPDAAHAEPSARPRPPRQDFESEVGTALRSRPGSLWARIG
jgi:Na+/proline symporter